MTAMDTQSTRDARGAGSGGNAMGSWRSDLMRRADDAGCKHLVVCIDVPSLGKRPRDIRNGLTVPTRLNLRSLGQILARPSWAMATARHGTPQFETIKPYLKNAGNMAEMSDFIRKTLKDIVDRDLLKQIRDQWPHKLIVKGIASSEDTELALESGADAIIVSNHGGRQLDASIPPVELVSMIKSELSQNIPVMADGGVESGVDIARFLSRGADMVFSGRAMMYGVAALGAGGAEHVIGLSREELNQVMEQLRCEHPPAMINHSVSRDPCLIQIDNSLRIGGEVIKPKLLVSGQLNFQRRFDCAGAWISLQYVFCAI